ncbi:MAG: class I SAM-dependent methyltransferase family protein [Candidatus Nanohaloarchaea archaeon]|nr:class I SAM-dependent methyltransferase family protein [Candidatus Nanohaloarchaea archaeon]
MAADGTQDDYRERVKELFEQQGFTVTAEGAGLRADHDGTTIRLLPLVDATIDEIEERIADDRDTRTIVFTDLDVDEDEKKALEERCGDNVELSLFDPYQEQEAPDVPDNMPSSYEIIGDVAVLNLDTMPDNRDEIADAVIRQNPNVETVLAKTGSLSGEFRVGDYVPLRGDRTETVHREHGCRYRVDPTKVYFSERLGHERKRVADQVRDGEHVQVWFAGAGPYAVLFARKHDVTVDAIEKNPVGCDYLEQNIELNSVEDQVTAHCGDVREVVPDLDAPDRIVMPLPGSADEFLDLAFDVAPEGCTVHYYRFSEEEDRWEQPISEIRDTAERAGATVSIDRKEVCGHYAPYVDRVCVDFTVTGAKFK